MNITKNTRFVALDFETTGLDIIKDEPIQIGIVVADADFRIINSYQSLIKPKKDIKQLKSVVSHITGLQLSDLSDSPSMEDILDQVKTLITPNSILIGHNIAFDI
jgi:DNA polymerase-3 subunit epsilon